MSAEKTLEVSPGHDDFGGEILVANRKPPRWFTKVPYIAMPNIILDRAVVPELVQARASAEEIDRELSRYLDDEAHRRRTTEALAGIRSSLVVPGAAHRAARLAVEMLA